MQSAYSIRSIDETPSDLCASQVEKLASSTGAHDPNFHCLEKNCERPLRVRQLDFFGEAKAARLHPYSD